MGKEIEYIKLAVFENFEKEFLEDISQNVSGIFNLPVKHISGKIEPGDYYDPTRRQYNANEILKFVEYNFAETNVKTLGLLRIDLYIPILTYIFGQAYLNGNAGIASLYRLKNEYYGIPKNDKLLKQRFIKEIIHELGHTFGLKHCHVPTCVMRSSTYVEDIDQKSENFCNQCKRDLNSNQ